MIDRELKQELQNIKAAIEKAKCKFSWWTLWMAGFLFTLGYSSSNRMVLDVIESNAPWYEQVIVGAFLFAIWPIILGIEMGGWQ